MDRLRFAPLCSLFIIFHFLRSHLTSRTHGVARGQRGSAQSDDARSDQALTHAALAYPYAATLLVGTAHSTQHPQPHPDPPFPYSDRSGCGSALTALSRYKNAIYPHVNPITARYTLITSSLRVPFKLHALAHISQLQLKASLSLHCVTNRGLPFLFEIVVGKTAWNKGRCMINHIAVC